MDPVINNDSVDQGSVSVFGTVAEALPNVLFRVTLDNNQEEKLAYLAGRMRLHRIRILVGDRVQLVMDPYGGKARIIKRL